MHYGDKHQIDAQRLKVVVYNHQILYCKKEQRFKKDGTFSKRYVDYQVTSIQYCELFNPRTLSKILREPYEIFNKEFSKRGLDPVEHEGFYEVEIISTDGYNAKIKSVLNVTDSADFYKQLH